MYIDVNQNKYKTYEKIDNPLSQVKSKYTLCKTYLIEVLVSQINEKPKKTLNYEFISHLLSFGK